MIQNEVLTSTRCERRREGYSALVRIAHGNWLCGVLKAIPWRCHFAFCLSFLLCAGDGEAQRSLPLRTLPDHALQGAVFTDPSRSSQRFLGWHYAAAAHQNTSQWRRTEGVPSLATSFEAGEHQGLSAPVIRALSGSSLQSAPIGGFASATSLPTGFIPTAVTQGDFNGDGKMDLAISNGGDNTVYVLLGNGDGTFALPEILYTQGQAPIWITAAQLRTNGHLDLIAVDADTNQVEVFTGNGDGTFQSSSIVANLPQSPSFVIAGDFNNDGNQDLAVGLVVDPGADEPQFEILLGNGQGSFPTTVIPPPVTNEGDIPLFTAWLAPGDLNKDGYVDIVTTVAFGGAIAYLNQKGSAFLEGPIFNPQDTAVTVALADMNGDGCLDAVEAGGYGLLTIAKGNCDGTFTQGTPVAEIGDLDVAMVITDVNGDGNPDIVASSAFTNGEEETGIGAVGGYLVSVLKGDGKGGVAPAAVYRVGSQAYGLAVADLRGNHRPDIITVSQNENNASELFNDASGGFGNPSGEVIGYTPTSAYSALITNSPNPVSVPFAQTIDVNGDGKPDVLLIENGYNSTLPSQVTALLNDGTGKLQQPIRSPITVGPNDPYPTFVAGNFRSAKMADVIYASTETDYTVAFIPGNGDGTFGAPVVLSTQLFPTLLVIGDFNNDGKLDFAVLGEVQGVAGPISPQLDVFLGNGNGTFNHLASQTLSSLTNVRLFQLIAADFNHDGKLDLMIGYETNNGAVGSPYNLDLALGNGDGTFQTPTLLMANFGTVQVADVNKDGYPDLIQEFDPNPTLIQTAINGLDGYEASAITIYLGGPGGQFTQSGSYFGTGILAGQIILGDFNGDGNLDVALPYLTTDNGPIWERRLQVFEGIGDGTFLPLGNYFQLPDYDDPMAGGDFRGVGVTDLLDLVGSTSSINTIPASPVSALTITPDNSPLTGNTGSATITLALPASATEVVEVASSDPAVSLPSSVTFAAGQSQQSLSFTIESGFDKTHVLALTAQLNGQTAVAYIPIANPNAIPGVTVQAGYFQAPPLSVIPGQTPAFLIFLESKNGYAGVFGDFTCSGLPAGASCNFSSPSLSLSGGGMAENGVSVAVPPGTALGAYSLTISANNGTITPSVTVPLNVGDYSLGINPSIISVDSTSAPQTTLTATFLNGLNETVTISCTGLPAGASCSIPTVLYPPLPTTEAIGLTVSSQSTPAPADYPFQIVGSVNGGASHSVNATLRVSSFSVSLDKTSAMISNGGIATFNATLTSVNHFTSSSIKMTCASLAGLICQSSIPFLTLTDGGTTTTQFTVNYTEPVATAASARRHLASNGSQALLCVVLLIFPWSIRRRSWRKTWCIVIAVALLTTISSCGGGGSTGGGGGGGGTGGGGGSQTVSVSVVAQAPISMGTLQVNVGTISLTVQ